MAKTTKRRFTDEFKREAVALWETRGRLQTEVAVNSGIVLTMLRRWQRKLLESSVPASNPAAQSTAVLFRPVVSGFCKDLAGAAPSGYPPGKLNKRDRDGAM